VGPTGYAGSTQGAPGATGAQGAVGPQGPTGPSATCYTHGILYGCGVPTQICLYPLTYCISTNVSNYSSSWDGCIDIQLYDDLVCGGWNLGAINARKPTSNCYGNINGSGYYTYAGSCSDRRLKTNITTLEDSLNKILQIDTVEFDWNDKLKDGKYVDANGLKKVHSVGLIAQNVKEFYPTVVKVGQNGYYYIEYVKLNAVLVEAIKEQQVFIDDIENQIKELESKFL
jgi:hypothetical protein